MLGGRSDSPFKDLAPTFETVERRLMSSFRKSVVDKIIDEVLIGKMGLYVCEIRCPKSGESNLVIVCSPTQNGKTMQMIGLAYMLFFRHGIVSFFFLRNDAAAYDDITKAVMDFNEKILAYLYALIDAGEVDGVLPEQYTLQLSTLSSQRRLSPADVVTIGRGGRRTLKPLIRCRLLSAQNVGYALEPHEIQALVEEVGVTSDGKRIKVAVFVDEAQGTRQSAGGNNYQLESNLFCKMPQFKYGIRRAAEKFLETHGLDQELAKNLNRSLRKAAALYIEVSATPEPTLILEADSGAQFVDCPIADDYYGFIEELDKTGRRIPILPMFGKNKDLDFDLSDLDYLEDERDRHLLIVEVCTRIGQHSKQFDHALVFHSLPSNNAVDEVAFFLTHNEVSLKDIKRPVVVICAYAFGRNFGATMFLNDAAADLFGKELLPAASDMFISLKRYKELQAAQPALYVGIPNNGQIVPHPDKDVRDKDYIMLKDIDSLENGVHFQLSADHKCLRLPRKVAFRLRTQLSVIAGACERSGVDVNSLLIITLGDRLLKEGLTVKTRCHKLAPTIGISTMTEAALLRKPAIDTAQSFGRLSGRRQNAADGIPDRCPVLLVPRNSVDHIKAVVGFNRDLTKRVGHRLRKNSAMSLGEATAGIVPSNIPHIVRPRVELGRTIAEIFPGCFTAHDAQKRAKLVEFINENFADRDEKAILFKIFDYIRDPVHEYASDAGPSSFIDFKELWDEMKQHYKNIDCLESLYDCVSQRLVGFAKSGTSDLVVFTDREGIHDGQGEAPIYIAEDFDGTQGNGLHGIVLSWNITLELNWRCKCKGDLHGRDGWIECLPCSVWFHQCYQEVAALLAAPKPEELTDLEWTCHECKQVSKTALTE